MATTDNKVLTGAGVEQLSQLVKSAIAEGGGTEYTAGLGVGIGDKNNLTSIGAFIPWLMTGNNLATQYLLKDSATQVATREEFITALKQGKIVYISSYAVGTFIGLSQWQEIFPDITSVYDVKVYTIDGTARTATKKNSPSVSTAFNDNYAIEEGTHSFFIFTNGTLFPTIGDAYIGTHTGITSTKLGGAIDELAAKETPIATTETPGAVIPDGTTITIDSNGVISSQGGGGSSYTFTNGLTESGGTVSWDGYYTTPDTQGAAVNLGYNNTVYNYSKGVAIGVKCQAGEFASGLQATAIGKGCKATGNCSFAGGQDARAQGKGAFSYGIENYAYGDYSVSLGQGTSARTVGCVALGTYNIENASFRVWSENQYYWGDGEIVRYGDYLYKSISRTAPATTANAPTGEATSNTWWEYVSPVPPIYKLIFGNGTATNARSNLMAVDDYGNGCFSGDLYVKASNYSLRGAGGQKVFYGTLTSTDTAPTVEGAINWVYK